MVESNLSYTIIGQLYEIPTLEGEQGIITRGSVVLQSHHELGSLLEALNEVQDDGVDVFAAVGAELEVLGAYGGDGDGLTVVTVACRLVVRYRDDLRVSQLT